MTKKLMMAGLLAFVASALADDAPHWIGLDTTLRDQVAWVAPKTEAFGRAIDTRVFDFRASVGTSVYGSGRPGLCILVW